MGAWRLLSIGSRKSEVGRNATYRLRHQVAARGSRAVSRTKRFWADRLRRQCASTETAAARSGGCQCRDLGSRQRSRCGRLKLCAVATLSQSISTSDRAGVDVAPGLEPELARLRCCAHHPLQARDELTCHSCSQCATPILIMSKCTALVAVNGYSSKAFVETAVMRAEVDKFHARARGALGHYQRTGSAHTERTYSPLS